MTVFFLNLEPDHILLYLQNPNFSEKQNYIINLLFILHASQE